MSSSITRGAAIAATAAIAVGAAIAVPSGLGQTPANPPAPLSPKPGQVGAPLYEMTGADVSARFTDLISMTSEVETHEYMEAGSTGPQMRRMVGRLKPPTVTLRRPMTYGLGLAQWHALVREGLPNAFKTVVLTLYAGAGGKAVARWQLVNAWPSKLEVVAVRDVLTETVTFSAEELVRDSPS